MQRGLVLEFDPAAIDPTEIDRAVDLSEYGEDFEGWDNLDATKTLIMGFYADSERSGKKETSGLMGLS
jgi:hypothetical protein